MAQIERLELPLWDLLRAATYAPDGADVRQLLDVLDAALLGLDTVGQLQVAAEAIAQIVQVFQSRSLLAFEELEATASEDGPIMPEDTFDSYVRQTMAVDFDQFIEPLASLPRKLPERSPVADEGQSVVGLLDQTALLHALDERMQTEGLTEAEAFNQAFAIAHDEDVVGWGAVIKAWLSQQSHRAVPLMHVQQAVGMPLVQVWLALLLNGYSLEQRGHFYDSNEIWVLQQEAVS